MAKGIPRSPLKRTQGFTLIEVLLGTLLVAFVASAVAVLFQHGEYTALKARIDGRVAALTRYHSMRMLHMPYSRLTDPATSLSETGFLYQPASPSGYANLYPYTVRSTVTPAGSNGDLRIATFIEWEEPAPEFSNPAPLRKRIDLGTHTRRRL